MTTIQFIPLSNGATDSSSQNQRWGWIQPMPKGYVETALENFFLALLNAHPQPSAKPLVCDQQTLHAIYLHPDPTLIEGICSLAGDFMAEFNLGDRSLDIRVDLIGLALIVYNLHTSALRKDPHHPALGWLAAQAKQLRLYNTTWGELVVSHTLIRSLTFSDGHIPSHLRTIIALLVDNSPLTALCRPDLGYFSGLYQLGISLLSHFEKKEIQPTAEIDSDAWQKTIEKLVSIRQIERLIHRTWIHSHATASASLGIGLMCENLRQTGRFRDFLLRYYETYAYISSQKTAGSIKSKNGAVWPYFDEIERLLLFDHQKNKIAIHFNRLGREKLLHFYPLHKIIESEGGVIPTDYKHLTGVFCTKIDNLLKFGPIGPNANQKSFSV